VSTKLHLSLFVFVLGANFRIVANKIQKIWENYVFFGKTIAKQKKQFAKLSKPQN
jgi:hypothetical protein